MNQQELNEFKSLLNSPTPSGLVTCGQGTVYAGRHQFVGYNPPPEARCIRCRSTKADVDKWEAHKVAQTALDGSVSR